MTIDLKQSVQIDYSVALSLYAISIMFVVVYSSNSSLLDDEVSQHLEILSISLLIVNLIIEADEAMKHVEVGAESSGDGWNGNAISALDQLVPASAPVQDGARSDHSGDCGEEGTETRLGLPDAEALVVVEEVG